jgi:hypothetical protein
MCALNFIEGDLCHKTDKSTNITGANENMKIPQSGSFVAFSYFLPVPPDAKYNT